MPRGNSQVNTTSTNKKAQSSDKLAKAAGWLIKAADKQPVVVRSYAELIAALATSSQIILGSDIIAEDNVLINRSVSIDFNGYSIISEESRASARVLDIRSGEVTFTGRGKIFAMGKNGVAIRAFGAISTNVPNYTTLTVGEGISLFAPDSYGILISPNLGVAYGLTVNFAGQIFAHDGICLAGGIRGYDPAMPTINIQAGANVMADERSGAALEATGYGKWNIASARLCGAIGANLGTGVFKFDCAQIVASHGECFRIVEDPDALLEVNIEGGNYVSTETSIITGDSKATKMFEIKNCNFYNPCDPIATSVSNSVKTHKVNYYSDVQTFFSSSSPLVESNPALELAPAPTISDLPPASAIDELTELTDDATDEQEILSALAAEAAETTIETAAATRETAAAEETETTKQTPATNRLAPAPVAPAAFSEQDAARRALDDAISDIRKLKAEDYDAGFGELEQAIQSAEQILANPLASLADICAAASTLLRAFDGLEECDDSAFISDEELDELFYHGAVLQEMLQEPKKEKHHHRKKHDDKIELPYYQTASPYDAEPNPNLIPDFTALTAVLTEISELNLNGYTAASQAKLLQTLADAQKILSDPAATQPQVELLTNQLSAEIAQLVPLRQPSDVRAHNSTAFRATLSSPAPVLSSPIAPTMIDELAPAAVWSLGVTMIDEMTPFNIDSDARAALAVQTKLHLIKASLIKPFAKLGKSLTAGVYAGVNAYREALRATHF